MSHPPNLSNSSDQEVVALALKGREDAYFELVRRYERPVYTLLYRMVDERETAEDLTQETFGRAFEALEHYRPDLKFSPWLFGIANRVGADHLRHREPETLALVNTPDVTPSGRTTVRASLLPDGSQSTPPSRVHSREFAAALEQAIRRLSRDYRRCVVLRYIEGRSYGEIARAMNLPVGTVGTYLHRARNELREMLGPLLDASPSDPFSTPA